jgi:hypothetical protein
MLTLTASTSGELLDGTKISEGTAQNLILETQKLLWEKGYLELRRIAGLLAGFSNKEKQASEVHDRLEEPGRSPLAEASEPKL